MAPPYLFTGYQVGLTQVAAIIGFLIGCFAGGCLADVITEIVIRKQREAVYPDQRLIAMLPGCLVAPIECIVIAFACAHKLYWIAIAFEFGMGMSHSCFPYYSDPSQCRSERFLRRILRLPTSSNATPEMLLRRWLRSTSLKIWSPFYSCTLL
jgi:MFS family permease